MKKSAGPAVFAAVPRGTPFFRGGGLLEDYQFRTAKKAEKN